MNERIWRCTWCLAESHAPEPDELIICPLCGTAGVSDEPLEEVLARGEKSRE